MLQWTVLLVISSTSSCKSTSAHKKHKRPYRKGLYVCQASWQPGLLHAPLARYWHQGIPVLNPSCSQLKRMCHWRWSKLNGRVQYNATAEVILERVRQADMLFCWALRAVTLAGGKTAEIFSIPDSSSALFFLYKIAALPAVKGSEKRNLFLKLPLHFCLVPRECNAVLRSLDSLCVFYHYLSNRYLPLGNHLVHFLISWHWIMTGHYELDFTQFGYMIQLHLSTLLGLHSHP